MTRLLLLLAVLLGLVAIYQLAVWWSGRVLAEPDPYATPDWGLRC